VGLSKGEEEGNKEGLNAADQISACRRTTSTQCNLADLPKLVIFAQHQLFQSAISSKFLRLISYIDKMASDNGGRFIPPHLRGLANGPPGGQLPPFAQQDFRSAPPPMNGGIVPALQQDP